MTIVSTEREKKTAGNDVTTSFAVGFQYSPGGLFVYLLSSQYQDPLPAPLTEGVDYSLSGDGAAGTATIIMGTAPATGQWLYRNRVTPLTQEAKYVANDGFPASAHEGALDKLTMQVQEVRGDTDQTKLRALLLPKGESVDPLPAAAERAGKFFAFDGVGVPSLASGTGNDPALRSDLADEDIAGRLLAARVANGVLRTQTDFNEDIVGQGAFGANTAADASINNDAIGTQLYDTGRFDAYRRASYTVNSVPVPSSSRIANVDLTSAVNNILYFPTNAYNVTVSNAGITTTADVGILLNSAGVKNLRFAGNNFDVFGYPILDNEGATGSDGVWVFCNRIRSRAGDGIAFNHPGIDDATRRFAFGNVIDAELEGSSPASGFAISIARTRGVIAAFNHIGVSRQEVVHVEDGQRRTVVSIFTASDAKQDGVLVLTPSVAQGGADGVIVTNSHLNHTGTKTGFAGFRAVYDANGTLSFNLVDANYFRGFGIGIDLGADCIQAEGVTVVVDADQARAQGKNSVAQGMVYAQNADAGHLGGAASFAGGIVSDTYHATPVVKSSTDKPGVTVSSLIYPFAVAGAAGGYPEGVLLTLPAMMRGIIEIMSPSDPNNAVYYSANIFWDGTTLTVTDPYDGAMGAWADPVLAEDSGGLKFSFFNGGGAVNKTFRYKFAGQFYVA